MVVTFDALLIKNQFIHLPLDWVFVHLNLKFKNESKHGQRSYDNNDIEIKLHTRRADAHQHTKECIYI